jgi:hypothetical protein
MTRLFLFSLAIAFSIPVSAVAGPDATNDFSSGALPETWAAVKGDWKIADEVLVGKELESDKHAAVFNIPDPQKDSKISFRFRLDGAKGFHLSYNHPKGHLFRIILTGNTISLNIDKDKKDPNSKGEVLGKADLVTNSGAWLEMTCEVKGDTATVTCGDVKLSGSHPNLTKEKTGYRFIVMGSSVSIDDVAFTSSN